MRTTTRWIRLGAAAMAAALLALTVGGGGSAAAADDDFPTTVEPAAGIAGYNVYRPADLGATGAPLPVIVWANGGCFRYDAVWQPLLERWASAGFVVVAITAKAWWWPFEFSTAADQALAIDWAEQQNATADSPYAGRLDLDRVVAAGNSCGGITSLELASTDERVSSVFVLSGSSAAPGAPPADAQAVIEAIEAPIGYAVGGPEDLARANAQQDVDFADHIPAYLAGRATGDHITVSTTPEILLEVAEIGINWMDFTLNGDQAARQALETNPCAQCEPGLWTPRAENFDLVGGTATG